MPFSARRFARGLSHDVGRRGRIKPQHIVAVIILVVGGIWGGIEVHDRLTHVFEYDARVSGDLITISSRVAGWVTKVAVVEGQSVEKDQVLFQIDARESELKLVELDAQVKHNRADRERLRSERKLIDEQVRSRYTTLESAVNAAEASIASLTAQLDLVAFLLVPTGVRLARLRDREREAFGREALAPGGRMHANHVAFLEWAASYDRGGLDVRSLARHTAWLEELPCPVLRLEGERTIDEQVEAVIDRLPREACDG